MRRKIIVVGVVLGVILFLSLTASAQFINYNSLSSPELMMSDWQLDYIRPIDPADLEKGEFRLTPIIGGINTNDYRNDISGDNDYDIDNNTLVYMLAFDSKFTEKLSFHSKIFYRPWDDFESSYFSSTSENESRSTLTDLFFNYQFNQEKNFFLGYNRNFNKSKTYDRNDILDEKEEETVNTYYFGFEMKGNFLN